jgi:hypothetical protein
MKCGHVDRKGRACIRQFHIGPHVYKRVAVRGARKARTAAAERDFRQKLVERSEGWCEARTVIDRWCPDSLDLADPDYLALVTRAQYELLSRVCGTVILHPGRDPHHVDPKDRARNVHDPERGLWICGQAHDFVHQREPRLARQVGLLA